MALTSAAADVVSVLGQYRQVLVAGHQEMVGDPAALEAAAQRLNGTVRQVDGAQGSLADAHRRLAEAWQAPSYDGFDQRATRYDQQLAGARSTLSLQEDALRNAATQLRTAGTRSADLIAQYDRNANALTASAGSVPPDARTLDAAHQLGRTYVEASAGIRRDLGAALNAIAATLAAPAQAGGRITNMTMDQVNYIISHAGDYPLGTVAGAVAHRYLLEHQQAHARWGIGTIHGTQGSAGPVPHPLPPGHPGVTRLDCTTFTLRVMREALIAKGMTNQEQWRDLVREATNNQRYRPAGAARELTGTEIINSLDRRYDWDSVFWSPDPTNPGDGLVRHREDYNTVNNRGEYWGVPVDRDRSVINYRRTNPGDPTETMRLNQLDDLPFGALVAGRGTHMAAIVNGEVYQVHYDRPATDPTTIEATPLDDPRWIWNSGILAAPKDELNRALAGSGSR